MTPLIAIRKVVESVHPTVAIATGFGADLEDFLRRERVSGVSVFVSLTLFSPKRRKEGGRLPGYEETYAIYIRGASNPARPEAGYYDLCIPLRDAIDGYEFIIGDQVFTIRVEPSGPLYESGFDAFQLNVTVS